MSFIRKIKKKNGKVYLAEVENVRVGDKTIQRHIRYVGKQADDKTILSCSISEAEVESVKLSGPLMVLHQIATNLGLPALLGQYADEILALTYAHCLDYQSLNQMENWFERTDLNLILELEDLTEYQLTNALDAIEGFDLIQKQREIFAKTQKLLKLKPSSVVYDVTNTYFHGKKCTIAKVGHDKENRKGYPLVQIGLAVTQEEGMPIFHKTFPGNIHDARTFMDISNDLVQFGIDNGTIVIDRGITSKENTAFMAKKHWEVLCGMKLDESIKKALGIFSPRQLTEKGQRVKMKQTVFYAREQRYRHGTIRGRLITIFNNKKELDMRESRLDEVEEAQLRLAKGQTIKPEMTELFDNRGKLIPAKLKEEASYDGLSFIFTTGKQPIEKIVRQYFDKDVVEKCFQSLKGVVRVRPVRHWLYNRVEAHIFICYLSYVLLSVLNIKVAKLKMSFQEAIEELDTLYRVYLRDPNKGYRTSRLVALTQKQEKILRAVDRRLIPKCGVQK